MSRNLVVAALAATSVAFLPPPGQGLYNPADLPNGNLPVVTPNKAGHFYPVKLRHAEAIRNILPSLSIPSLQSFLKPFTDFHTRYYQSATGIEAAQWLLSQVQTVVNGSGANATVQSYNHTKWEQISVIAKVPGKSNKTIVVGAHLDSVQGNSSGRAPGADDNGSGVVTILEAMRVLLSDPTIASGRANHSLEFHWYAAEEVGLFGSKDIMDDYAARGVDVAAYLNQDMTGWAPEGESGEFGIIMDFVDPGLTNFTRLLINEYTTLQAKDGQCGYACSDHASAHNAGFPAAFIFEAHPNNTSPYIHTRNDSYDTVSFEHILEHTKLVASFMYELAFASLG